MVGFTTVFEAYKNADQFRAKVAQVFVLPTCQGKGLGSKLYEQIYKHYLELPKCYELIVEDSNDNFQRV